MSSRHIKPAYVNFDPAHLFDGLFVPTNGKKRGRLQVNPRCFGQVDMGFQGFEQLGSDDQSILLALTAQLSIGGLQMIDANPQGPISQQLRLAMNFKNGDDGALVASKRTSLRSLLIDAGYSQNTSTGKAKQCLNRLANVQVRKIDHETGWDRRCNLISVSFNNKSGEVYVAANPRLTDTMFKGHQRVKISLFERNSLDSEIAKILHCWLCSNVRLGKSLGNGNGARIDTLAPHVWGSDWDTVSPKIKSIRRGNLHAALDEIVDRTCGLQGGNGWIIDQTSSGMVLVSRPKKLPFLEGEHNLTPNEFHEIMSQSL